MKESKAEIMKETKHVKVDSLLNCGDKRLVLELRMQITTNEGHNQK